MRYKLLGRSGLRESELCLGTMTFGTEWPLGTDQESSKQIFDVFANAGGTFIDTANRYTEGSSERFVGEFIAADRDHFVPSAPANPPKWRIAWVASTSSSRKNKWQN